MDVQAALKLGDLQNASILAGGNGINREIKAAEVMEVPDISGWLTEGIFIISTFYSVKDSPELQIKMFKSLIEVNGAGLVIKVGRYIKELPQEMYDLANKHNMPIIALPVEVSFVNVLSMLFESIYEEKKAYQFEQQELINQLVIREVKSIKEFVSELSSITGENVYFETSNYHLIATARRETDKRRNNYHYLSLPKQGINTSKQLWDEKNNELIHLDDRIILPIDDLEGRMGYLHVILKRSKALVEPLQSSSVRIKEQAKLLVLKDQYDIEKRYLQETKFLNHLVKEKKVVKSNYINSRLNVNENYLYGFFALDFTNVTEKLRNSLENDSMTLSFLYKKVYEVIDNVVRNTLMYHEDAIFYGLYVCQDQQIRPLIIEKLKDVVFQFKKEFNQEIYCGISLAHKELIDLYKARDEANLCLQTKDELNLKDDILLYEQLGINKIFLKLKHDVDVLDFIDFTLEAINNEDNENGELLTTLEVFLQENGNHTKTSEALFIHRRTLKYRLTKIESILNRNLDDSDTRFLLYFLLKMRKINVTHKT